MQKIKHINIKNQSLFFLSKYPLNKLILGVPIKVAVKIFTGFLFICREAYLKKELSEYNKFLLFQVLSILYFVSVSGFWGNTKYFIPCAINLSFFFAQGLRIYFDYFKKIISKFQLIY